MVDICDELMEFERGDVIEGREGRQFVITNRIWNLDDERGWVELDVLDADETVPDEVRIPASGLYEAELVE